MIRLHYLQHAAFEGPARIQDWAHRKGHVLSGTRVDETQDFPSMQSFDWLVILGGPMNVYEEEKYPWLKEEKAFIKDAIRNKKVVLGVCLGAQLIADALGGHVYKNHHKEIGWYPVFLTPKAKKSPVFGKLPESFEVFHWHGDTFDLPAGCVRMLESEACVNQAFEYETRVFGLQCHFESSSDSIESLVKIAATSLSAENSFRVKRKSWPCPESLGRLENI